MKYLLLLLLVSCSSLKGPVGPTGLTGPQGAEGSRGFQGESGIGDFYSTIGILFSSDYDTTGWWDVSVYIPDSSEVGCRVRRGSGFLWVEPERWHHGSWYVRIVDYSKIYSNYEYKITVISK